MTPRSFLFLQGPHGPFFRQLGTALQRLGHDVVRVNFNGGDVASWGLRDAVAFRGSLADWESFVVRISDLRQITDVVLYGDCRPVHRQALASLAWDGPRVHVWEEGYFRPNWVTLEAGGVNGRSRLPEKPATFAEIGADLDGETDGPEVGPTTRAMVKACLGYYGAVLAGLPAFWRYQTHRPVSPLSEACAWARRSIGAARREQRAAMVVDRVLAGPSPFYVLVLQLDADAQVIHHSSFSGMSEVIERVVSSFARCAPDGTSLVIKNHPLDNGLVDYAALARRVARRFGVAHRVVYLDGGSLPALIRDAEGVVVVNSTAGLSALHHGVPTIALGKAVYAIPGLTDQRDLDAFWPSPVPPDKALYQAFRRVVMARTQLRGSFYTPLGRRLLLPEAVRRLQEYPRILAGGMDDRRCLDHVWGRAGMVDWDYATSRGAPPSEPDFSTLRDVA